MIDDLAENFLELSCLLLAAGVALGIVISAIKAKPRPRSDSEDRP